MRERGLRSVLLHMSRPMTAKRAERDCEADVVLLNSYFIFSLSQENQAASGHDQNRA
jgi:hypothetical protein